MMNIVDILQTMIHDIDTLQTESDMTQPNLITSSKVRERLGGISESTLYRYMRSETLNFPKSFTFGRRHLWDAAEIEDFIRARRKTPSTPQNAQAHFTSAEAGQSAAGVASAAG